MGKKPYSKIHYQDEQSSFLPKTENQKAYVKAVKSNTITFAVGPAGTGKTYQAVAIAAEALKNKEVTKLLFIRPIVEACGEKLGYLPGDIAEKVNPYLTPIFDALDDILGNKVVDELVKCRIIEVTALAFCRGRTFKDAFVILDEAQNTTTEQMKMFLTRIGQGSKMIITGDEDQSDIKKDSGLKNAIKILDNLQNIAIVKLTDQDNVRHPIINSILARYQSC